MKVMKVFLFFIGLVIVSDKSLGKSTLPQERLMTDLFLNYDATRRPAEPGVKVIVNVSVVLEHFDFRERDGSFHFVGHLIASWRDPKLAWNPLNYENIKEIPVNQKILWVPDLEFYNNAPDRFLRTHRKGTVSILHTGVCLWIDTIEVSIFCSKDMDNWPHDVHTCKLSLGSWTHHALDVDINNELPNTTMSFEEIDQKNMEYQITDFSSVHVSTIYNCCTEPYTTIEYNITIQRNSNFVIVFRVAAICIMIFSMLSLACHTNRIEKLWLNGFSLLVIVMCLIYFAQQIGSFTHGTPVIVTFFKNAMILVTFAQLVCIFCLLVSCSFFKGRLPKFVLCILKFPLVSFIAPLEKNLEQQDISSYNSRFEEVKLQESSNLISVVSVPSEWNQLSLFVQRTAFILFGICFALLSKKCYV